jgi:signal peptide peptidase-like protein 2B
VLKWPHLVVIILNVFFGLGATGALSFMFIQPIFSRVCPIFSRKEVSCVLTSRGEFVSTALAFLFATLWFIFRHESFAWAMQDILALSLVFSFLLAIRIQNLRLATILLSSFFFYDIFMVFISPAIFAGRSVMVEVATAGAASEVTSDKGECIRNEEERMPMLFAFPRFDWLGGYSMIGLGDIVIPGLLISFALRVDYARCEKLARIRAETSAHLPSARRLSFFGAHYYWIPLCCSYIVGLSLTFAANIEGWTFGTGIPGQPALLYLVPCTLLTMIFLAKRKGELMPLWNESWIEWTEQEQLSLAQQQIQEAGIDGELEKRSRINVAIRRHDSLIMPSTEGEEGELEDTRAAGTTTPPRRNYGATKEVGSSRGML